MKSLTKEYPLIPMSEITDEARKIAIAWMECEDKSWIGQKHKLASDIMNYAKHQSDQTHEQDMKFAEFCIINGYRAYPDGDYGICDFDGSFKTLAELYKHWQKNIAK